MTATIDTKQIGNLIIFQGRIIELPADVKPCGERNEHFDLVLKSNATEIQVIFRGDAGRKALDLKLKKGASVSVIGYLESDGYDTYIVADSVEAVL